MGNFIECAPCQDIEFPHPSQKLCVIFDSYLSFVFHAYQLWNGRGQPPMLLTLPFWTHEFSCISFPVLDVNKIANSIITKKKKHYSNHFLILITKIAITRILSDSLLHMQPILYGNYSICFRHPNTLCLCLYVTFSSSSVEIAVLPKKPSLHANALKKVCLVLSKRLWDPALFYFGFALIILPCFSHFALLPLSFNLKYSICGCLWAENASYSFLRSTHTAWSPHHCKNRYF